MKATNWEFSNRAILFGLIFGLCFPLYSIDHENAASALAHWLGAVSHAGAEAMARAILVVAAMLMALAALLRTWASAYLHSGIVYASELKSQELVADGPYRYVRNPLYLANVMMAMAMGALMSRFGFVFCVLLMWLFCYRLILREESELTASQGENYTAYKRAVPRLLPSFVPRVAAGHGKARWAEAFKAESWYWGFALSMAAFAATLQLKLFFIILAGSLGLFWLSSFLLKKQQDAQNDRASRAGQK